MIRRALAALVAMLICVPALAEMPEWTYPLEPELLEDRGG